jgi:hypothetical protein
MVLVECFAELSTFFLLTSLVVVVIFLFGQASDLERQEQGYEYEWKVLENDPFCEKRVCGSGFFKMRIIG